MASTDEPYPRASIRRAWAYQRAYSRSLRTLRDNHREEFDQVMEHEFAAAMDEVDAETADLRARGI